MLVTIIACWLVIAIRNVRMVRGFQVIEGRWSSMGLTGVRPHEIRASINAMQANKIEPLKFWVLQLKRGTFLVPDSHADVKLMVRVEDRK
jgi:hypothetical protein